MKFYHFVARTIMCTLHSLYSPNCTHSSNNNTEMPHKILNWCHELNGETLFVIESRLELNSHLVWCADILSQYTMFSCPWRTGDEETEKEKVGGCTMCKEIENDWVYCSRDYSIAKPQIDSWKVEFPSEGLNTVNTLTSSLALIILLTRSYSLKDSRAN